MSPWNPRPLPSTPIKAEPQAHVLYLCLLWPYYVVPGVVWFPGLVSNLLSLSSHQVVSDSLQPQGLQHARPPYPSPSPSVCPSSCPSNGWCHPTVSSSVTFFSFCLQSFPTSGSFPVSDSLHQVAKGLELQLVSNKASIFSKYPDGCCWRMSCSHKNHKGWSCPTLVISKLRLASSPS